MREIWSREIVWSKEAPMVKIQRALNQGRVYVDVEFRPEDIDEPGEYLKCLETSWKGHGQIYGDNDFIWVNHIHEAGSMFQVKVEFDHYLKRLEEYLDNGMIVKVELYPPEKKRHMTFHL